MSPISVPQNSTTSQHHDSSGPLVAREQFDGPVHNLLLRGVGTQLLRGLLGHIAEANQQGIQSFGDLAVWQSRKLKEST